jgi:hypothetical protein
MDLDSALGGVCLHRGQNRKRCKHSDVADDDDDNGDKVDEALEDQRHRFDRKEEVLAVHTSDQARSKNKEQQRKKKAGPEADGAHLRADFEVLPHHVRRL